MKRVFTLIAGLLVSGLIVHATVRTVSNNPAIPAQYSGLQAAIDDADAGDTILVAGSASTYGSITTVKSLVIVGAGYNNPYGYNSIIDYLSLTRSNAAIGASGTKVSGFNIRYGLHFYGEFSGGDVDNQLMENIVVERCRIVHIDWSDDQVKYTNDTVRNCLIQDSYMYFMDGVYTDVRIHNNIFDNYYMYQNGDSDLSGVYLENNVMLDGVTNFFYIPNSEINNMVVQNNIFYDAEPQGCVGCVFNNNITYLNSNDELPGAGNTGSGNLIGEDPNFADYPFDGGGFTYDHDFTVDPGIAVDGGTDGSDIGMTGGMMPYVPGNNPRIPQVTEIGFPDNASSVKVGGTLNVSFKAKKQD